MALALRPAVENPRSIMPEQLSESAEIWIRDPIGVPRCSPQSEALYIFGLSRSVSCQPIRGENEIISRANLTGADTEGFGYLQQNVALTSLSDAFQNMDPIRRSQEPIGSVPLSIACQRARTGRTWFFPFEL
jgi:hypothetical protein